MRPHKEQQIEIEKQVQWNVQDAIEMDEPYTPEEIEKMRQEITEYRIVYEPIFCEYETYIVSQGQTVSEMLEGLSQKEIYEEMPKNLFEEMKKIFLKTAKANKAVRTVMNKKFNPKKKNRSRSD